jgi:ABC-type uncharacterized transport system ATPase subunit
MVIEDTPHALRAQLEGRILAVRGEPLNDLRERALAEPAVESVQAFGDRLHLRVQPGSARAVTENLQNAAGTGVVIRKIEVVQPSLEDVFIALLETDH